MPNPNDLILIGILLLALVTVESGGYFLTRVVRGHVPANRLQMSFFRAGHAHAAVLLVLSIAILAGPPTTNVFVGSSETVPGFCVAAVRPRVDVENEPV